MLRSIVMRCTSSESLLLRHRLLMGKLHAASLFRPVHPHERLARSRTDRQQSMVAQDQHPFVIKIASQSFALVQVRRDSFVIVIAGLRYNDQRVLCQGQNTVALTATPVPAAVWVCITKLISDLAAWTALWMVKPAGLIPLSD